MAEAWLPVWCDFEHLVLHAPSTLCDLLQAPVSHDHHHLRGSPFMREQHGMMLRSSACELNGKNLFCRLC